MNKNQKPSMSKRRATVAAVLCFVAAIAIAGTYTFNDYRKTQKNELAKAGEKAKQDSEAAKETGTSKIKNEDMTSDTDESDSNGTGKDGTTTGSGTTDSGTTDSGTTGTSGSEGTGTSGSSGQTGTQATAGKSHNINFTEDSYILWPVNGAVIMSYSMDKTVYFQTLDQYKYNPAVIIEGAEGDQVLCGAPGIVKSIDVSAQTGTTVTKDQLQEWVDYANKVGAVIIYDAAYEAYISEDNVAHSIYECKGARTCAIELHSFSKNAGFTGVRLGYTVVPKDLKCGEVSLHDMWARRHGTKFNGAPYIVQRAGEAVYSEEGKAQLKEQVAYYMKNAKTIKEGLKDAGYTVFGGVNAPYIWLKTPDQMTSWEFFDYLLENANVVGTPGSGFGPSGEGYFRLTAFGNYENTVKALERIKAL